MQVIRLALSVGAFLKTNWPRILEGWTAISSYLDKHPNLPDDVRRRMENVRDRLAAARKHKSEEAQIRAMLDVVTGLDPGGTGRPDYAERAARLRMALDVAETLSSRERRRALRSIRTKTDALAAEAIASLVPADDHPDRPGT